jgi:Na+/H+ antiporter NhaD/arsenite permease-like protein
MVPAPPRAALTGSPPEGPDRHPFVAMARSLILYLLFCLLALSVGTAKANPSTTRSAVSVALVAKAPGAAWESGGAGVAAPIGQVTQEAKGAGLGPAPTDAHGATSGGGHSEEQAGGHAKWTHVPFWAVIPFIVMLLCIAIIPLFNEHWWENNRNRGAVAAALGIPVILYTLFVAPSPGTVIWHTAEEYLSFIALLGSLFIISGGVVITGNLIGKPTVNVSFLFIGGIMASFIGTTGAAMLLIRPLLKTNSERRHKLHTVIFFIFIVCNCGGCLTPLGDPPLFLGYLKGVPFTWTFGLWPEWLFVCGTLLVMYFIFDVIQYGREEKIDVKKDIAHERPLIIRGGHNFFFLVGVVAAVAFSLPFGPREGVMILMILLAWKSTRPEYRQQNEFNFAPILEVVVVFSGIFATMIPALALLNDQGATLGVDTSFKFYWATGTLSAFLDNAPTYVSFLEMAGGIEDWSPHLKEHALAFTQGHSIAGPGVNWDIAVAEAAKWPAKSTVYVIPDHILKSVSLGAVFMGAMTYIGNGPNFMVRAIAQGAGVKMPSFFGYMGWSVLFLLPVLFVQVILFLA